VRTNACAPHARRQLGRLDIVQHRESLYTMSSTKKARKSAAIVASAAPMTEAEILRRISKQHTTPNRVLRMYSADGESLSFGELRKAMVALGCPLKVEDVQMLAAAHPGPPRNDNAPTIDLKSLVRLESHTSDERKDYWHLSPKPAAHDKDHALEVSVSRPLPASSPVQDTRFLSFDSDGLVLHSSNFPISRPISSPEKSKLASPVRMMSAAKAFRDQIITDGEAVIAQDMHASHKRPPMQTYRPGTLDASRGIASWVAEGEWGGPARQHEVQVVPQSPAHLMTSTPLLFVTTPEDFPSSLKRSPAFEPSLEQLALLPYSDGSMFEQMDIKAVRLDCLKTSEDNVLIDFLSPHPNSIPSPFVPAVMSPGGYKPLASNRRVSPSVTTLTAKSALHPHPTYSFKLANKVRKTIRNLLSSSNHSAAAQLIAFLGRDDPDKDGVIRDVDLWKRLKAMVPDITAEEIAHTLAAIGEGTERTPGNKPTGAAVGTNSSEREIDIKHFAQWVMTEAGTSHSSAEGASNAAAAAGETPKDDSSIGSFESGFLADKGNSFAAIHAKKKTLHGNKGAAPSETHTPTSERLNWTSPTATFDSFRRNWENKFGAAACKELATDHARVPEGPTWTSAQPSPFKVLHLASPPPASRQASTGVGTPRTQ
jgi:hypothetical protein